MVFQVSDKMVKTFYETVIEKLNDNRNNWKNYRQQAYDNAAVVSDV